LINHYPNAKVVLTVRDPDEWFDSIQATIAPLIAARGKHDIPHVNAIAEMAYKLISVPVFNDRLSDREYATQVFRQHTADVQDTVPAERLLIFDVREGWEPLCDFLDVEVPDTPFHKTNSSKDFKDHVEEGKA